MGENKKLFISSSDLFSGYEVSIDLNYTNTINDIIDCFYNNLHTYLSMGKFVLLLEELKKTNFHIHGYTYEDILLSKTDIVFYICGNCYDY